MPVTPLNDRQIQSIATKEGIGTELVRDIATAAVAHDVPPTLLLAVAKRETDFGRGVGFDAATGRGDGGHGYGLFQLDDRSPAHEPLLAQVQHDPAKAADVAASMLGDSFSRGHGTLDALHIYNHGSLGGETTRGRFEGRTVNYETAVAGWAREYDAAAGIAPPARAPESHAAAVAPTSADQALVNGRIAEAAEKLRGMSTRDAQTHHPELENGNVACAYSVNKVLDTALGRTYGENKEYVPSLMADLRRHGHEVAAGDVRPGDIAIKLPSHGERHGHIGIVTQGGESPRILNNSSSHGSLTNEDSPARFSRNYVTKREEDRVVYIRIDPSSVDLEHVRRNPIPERVLGDQNAPPDPTHWSEHRPVVGARRSPADGNGHDTVEPAVAASDRAPHANEKHVAEWTPGMDFAAFEKLVGKIRGGPVPERSTPGIERSPDRPAGLER